MKPLYGQSSMQVAFRYYGNFFSFAGKPSYGHGHFKQNFLAVLGGGGYLFVKQHNFRVNCPNVCFMFYIYFGIPRVIY